MKKILYIALLLICFTSYSSAQIVLDSKATVDNVQIKQLTDNKQHSLAISMDIDVSAVSLNSNSELKLTPRLTDGEHFKMLSPIIISGRKNAIYRQRNPYLFLNDSNGRIYKKLSSKKGPQVISGLIETIDFEPWMNGADLEIVESSCGCASTLLASNEYQLKHFLLPLPAMTPYTSYIEPDVEERKRRSIEASAYLDFPVGQTAIRIEYRNNAVELSKISQSISRVAQDEDIEISSIKLTGHASPEGSYALNQRLAKERTEALKRYLVSLYPEISPKYYKVDYVGENWDGLVKMLNDSFFIYKDEIMKIINTVSNLDAREQQLRKLDGGRAFKALVSDYFPSLRNTNYEIKYEIRQFTTEEAKELVWSQPQKLSVEEIYRVSEFYKNDNDKYAELFEVAVRMYPQDDIANLNASTSAIYAKNIERAKRYLDRVSNESQGAEYYNNKGICSFVEEDFDSAKLFFEKAIELGSDNAIKNLEQLNERVEYDRLTSKNK